jgi:hypothetical protein
MAALAASIGVAFTLIRTSMWPTLGTSGQWVAVLFNAAIVAWQLLTIQTARRAQPKFGNHGHWTAFILVALIVTGFLTGRDIVALVRD